jgi:hypothetical protein
VTEDTHETIAQYIHQCNAQKPSGESAFHTMCAEFGYAKNPMIQRISQIRKDINITMIYGSRSWVDNATGDTIKSIRSDSFVDVKIVNGAGHHVYADRAEVFNQYVLDICEQSDRMHKQVSLSERIVQQAAIENGTKKDEDEDEMKKS